MKLHSPQFERTLRRGVRKAIRRSSELKRQFRAANKYRQHNITRKLARPALSILPAVLVWNLLERTQHPVTALAVLTLWALAFVFLHARGLLMRLYAAPDLQSLLWLPVPESLIFRWELQQFTGRTLWTLADFIIGFGALAWAMNIPLIYAVAIIPISLLTWGTMLALSALSALHLAGFLRHILSYGGLMLFLLIVLLWIWGESVTPLLISTLDDAAPSLNMLLPVGWPVSLFRMLLAEDRGLFLTLLLPIGLVMSTLKHSYARFKTHYGFEETVAPESADLVPGSEEEDFGPAESSSALDPHLGSTAIAEKVESRLFLAPPIWPGWGWFETILWEWFNPREKAQAEFVFPEGLAITRPWFKMMRNFLIVLSATIATAFISPAYQFWILGLGLLIVLSQALARLLNSGRAFQKIGCSGVEIPLYAGFAIGYRELAQLLLKYTFVQSPLFITLTTVCGFLIAYLAHQPPLTGAEFGFKAGILILGSRFILISLSFSSGTNDSTRFHWRSLLLLLFIVGSGLGFLALGAASLWVPFPYVAWPLWLGALLDAYVFHRVYGWFYHANRFDLMSLPKS